MNSFKRKVPRYRVEAFPGYYMMDLVWFLPSRECVFYDKMDEIEDPDDEDYEDADVGVKEPWVFMLLNVCSRKIWLRDIPNKKKETLLAAFKSIYYYNGQEKTGLKLDISRILSDDESGWKPGTALHEFLKQQKIGHIIKDPSEHKVLGVLDSTVKHLKDYYEKIVGNPNFMPKTLNDYRDILLELEHHNNTIKKDAFDRLCSANEVFYDAKLQKDWYDYYRLLNDIIIYKHKDQRYKVGDLVKVLSRRTSFKGSLHWYDGVYKIKEVNDFSYRVDDPVLGRLRLKDDELKPATEKDITEADRNKKKLGEIIYQQRIRKRDISDCSYWTYYYSREE